MKKSRVVFSLFLLWTVCVSGEEIEKSVIAKPLSFTDRLVAQQAVERVYYQHRIWPETNKEPKPSFEQAVSEKLIRAKVERYLKQSALLEDYWHVPLTGQKLQAEMERMVQRSKDPATLRELFLALGNDPYVIAECLVRPVLADRLCRDLFAFDTDIHASLKQKVEQIEQGLTPENFLIIDAGQVREIRLVLDDVVDDSESAQERFLDGFAQAQADLAEHVDRHTFQKTVSAFPGETNEIVWNEEKYAFIFRLTIRHDANEFHGAMRLLNKTDFNAWFAQESGHYSLDIRDTGMFSYNLVTPKTVSGTFLPDSWASDPYVPGARTAHKAVWTGTEMIVWGGVDSSSTYLSDGGRYNPVTDCWQPMSTSNAPSGRALFSSIWTGSEMIVWGGHYYWAASGINLETGGRYNPNSDSWSATSTLDAPLPRCNHTAVWTGEEMIIWGGQGETSNFNDGAIYDPSNDSWRAISTTDPDTPGQLVLPSAIWTGTEMIVWGYMSLTPSGGRYNPETDTWVSVNNTDPDRPCWRSYNTAIWTGTEMIIWGGYTSGGPLNDGGRYNPDTDLWQSMDSNYAPSPRHFHSSLWTGSSLIVWGGLTTEGHESNIGGLYNPTLNSWTALNPEVSPCSRCVHTAVWTGEEMIIWGGRSDDGMYLSDGGRFNPHKVAPAWIEMNQADAPEARYRHSGIWTGTELIIWGGSNASSGEFNTGSRYTPSTDSWIATEILDAPHVRSAHTAIWTGSEMIVWGGYYFDGATICLNTGGRYDPLTDSWVATRILAAPSGRHSHEAVWTGSEMIIWGGYPTSTNTGGLYDPDTDFWTSTSTLNAPSGCYYSSSVWTGSEMIIWGGYPYTNTGGIYDPVGDVWTALDTSSAPSERRHHTAVWTGETMIVWGGRYGNTLYNSGGIYNVATDSWTATNQSDAPSPRGYHEGIWTGSELLIWGGWYYEGGSEYYLNTGGHYDPSIDRWKSMPTLVAPSPQYYAASVWTGSEMLVWGGYGNDVYYNTGGRYNPGYGEWYSLASSENTYLDYDHTAIWTGSEMLIWGGCLRSSFDLPGAKYDPAEDNWSELAKTGAPIVSARHSAIWTGSDMIVWGGYSYELDDCHNEGGLYNPLTDEWLLSDTGNAPEKRDNHTGIWTGEKMIIWAGSPTRTSYLNTGGQYIPSTDSWSATSVLDAPSERCLHTAIWAENTEPAYARMIIWGGGPFTGNNGGSYDPVLDTWFPLATANQPTRTLYHTAVWTGEEMLIWGGTDGSQEYNQGGRYDPFGDAWTLMSTENAPSGRDSHSAVWTGTEMIVWGGTISGGEKAGPARSEMVEGGRYSLSSDSWAMVPTLDAPQIRHDHSGLWTGQAMLIYGGISSSTLGIFYPNTGPTSTPDILNEDDTLILTEPAASVLRLSQSLPLSWFDDFEGEEQWTGSGEWLCFDDLSCGEVPGYYSATHAYYAGDDTLCNYTNINGEIVLFTQDHILVKLEADDRVLLTCRYFLATDSLKGDGARIRVRRQDTTTYITVAEDQTHWSGYPVEPLNDDCTGWETVTIDLSQFITFNATDPNNAVRIYFNFKADSVDNDALGWLIDDVSLGHPRGDGSNPTTTTSYHDQWDQASFEWDLNSDGLTDNPDPSTPFWEIEQAQLSSYGLDQPGDYPLELTVIDLLGLENSESVILHVIDGVSPTVEVIVPNGGESWVYSPDAADRNSHVLVWEAADNNEISRIKLSYTTNYIGTETIWTCIADSTDDDCLAEGLLETDTSYLWQMPTAAEAQADGQTFPSSECRIKVDVWDISNNTVADISDNNFYIVQPTTTGIMTLILWNSDRLCQSYDYPVHPDCECGSWSSDSDCSLTADMHAKLTELADYSKVAGIVLDLDAVTDIRTAYSAWDATALDPAEDNVDAANALAQAIRTYILEQLETYSNARYLILVGDDHQIPFYRMEDGTTFYPENLYPAEVGLTASTPVRAALLAGTSGYFLSDNYYTEISPEMTGLSSPHDLLYLNDLSIGRLVETPTQITDVINTYLSQGGQVNVFPTEGSDQVLVTGSDFLYDSAFAIKSEYVSKDFTEGTNLECLLEDKDNPDTGDPCLDEGFTPVDLETRLLSGTRNKINNINTHANHFSFAASEPASGNQILYCTDQSYDPISCHSSDMVNHAGMLTGSLLYTSGCHSGLVVPSLEPLALDLPELMSMKKNVAYVANTGYGWGLLQGRGLTEKLMEFLTDELLDNDSISIGRALAEAKRHYYLEVKRYDVFDEKVLHELTLFGIPNYLVVTDLDKAADPIGSLPRPDGPESGCAQGICLTKHLTRADQKADLPVGVTELELNFAFGSETYTEVETPKGSYYTLNGKASGEVGDAIQPHFSYDSKLSGTNAHGVLFVSGTYLSEASFDPVVAEPVSTNVSEGEGPLPLVSGFTPCIRVSYGSSGGSAQKAAGEEGYTNMIVHTGLFHSATTTQDHFDQMSFIIYYSNESDITPPTITDPGSSGFHTLEDYTAHFSVTVTDVSGVFRVLVTYLDDLNSAWHSMDLTYYVASNTWQGDLTLQGSIIYFVQAVDNAGNVGMLTESGPDLNGGDPPVPYGSTWTGPKTYGIELLDSDSDGLPDAYELLHDCLDPEISDAGADPDYDYLTNLEEFLLKSLPCEADTDGGGDNDGSEQHNGRDPLNENGDKQITIHMSKDATTCIIDWADEYGENGIIDGYYYVYRSDKPYFSPTDLVYGPLADGVTSQSDPGPSCDPCFYKVWNYEYDIYPPEVTVVMPGSQPAGQTATVSIFGDYFSAGARVTFCGMNATNVTVESANKIVCTTPALSAGSCDVTVINPTLQQGTLTDGYLYY
ncbi:IPT/TIG domain-containing protein [bacterium]|nr:IPT/TIG domain-containing protein [bacterium]